MNIFLGETESSKDGVEDVERRFQEAFNESCGFFGWMIMYLIPALEKRGLVITTRENYNAHKIY